MTQNVRVPVFTEDTDSVSFLYKGESKASTIGK